uniref:LOW QUALITY PROTEIN: coiled-coil domain-containing protein 191-like n=1 Tax=Castor canadensis TaxID=51338 RepID=A0A8B7TP23_CASCN|nr:LOW QUALITY PROTEIN: coiled-coil domain-containing protein 191-like [Castor canadensis]
MRTLLGAKPSRRTLSKTAILCMHKLIFDHRIKLGKAGTLSDWKASTGRSYEPDRDYTRSQKLEQEKQALEKNLEKKNRKQTSATSITGNKVLRRTCFVEKCGHWHGTEVLKKGGWLYQRSITRKKMDELLKVTAWPHLYEKLPLETNGPTPHIPLEKTKKGNLLGPHQNVIENNPDIKRHKTLDAEISQQPGGNKKLETSIQDAEPVCMEHFRNRHVYQQQLIEKQKKKLQEQQKIILELKENQRLVEAQWASKHAAAVKNSQNHLLSNPREAEDPKGTCQVLSNISATSSKTEDSRSDSRNSHSGPKRNPKHMMAPHPIVKAMEERAVQRAERRRILAEKKKKQEEEKLAQFKAQEEERQKREAEEKETQLEKKREEKRLKKMKELEKQKRIKRNQELETVAKEHYKMVLLRNKGLEPWKRLRMQSKQNIQVAEEHHSLALQKKSLLTWFQYSQESLVRKMTQADQFYTQLLLRRIFKGWLQYTTDLEEEVRKLCVHFLQKKIFGAWLTMVREATINSQSKHKIAAEHCDRKTLSITFQTWKKFIKFMTEERVKEERREQLRRKVAEILPDFQMLAPL